MIRKMKIEDIDAVYEVEVKAQTHPWSKKQFLDAVQSYSSTVLELNHQICGFCILQPVLDEANLLLMAIREDVQGQGFGYQLLVESMDQLVNSPVQIFLEVRQSNDHAIKLYEKAGFHQIDVRKNYYPQRGGGREHAVIMVKSCTDDFKALFS
ncbi:ribosomal protein S18-alanine N-acetyltransferase [Acinetobacter sp. B10A]|uniref:ribosomal protein S18-alanine N-acetyltransferase n=1 Tax=Acinetobacter baretiae TaxID=2605383 RepID=UPI001B3C613E|nr:ribosomal protein S18-alanine N-acetyltransferase [Acinetobacter baretiae]MBF7684769.1 ribosomal protein S18-alanine N-acetyltransferase [Acinetobacter baretiae]